MISAMFRKNHVTALFVAACTLVSAQSWAQVPTSTRWGLSRLKESALAKITTVSTYARKHPVKMVFGATGGVFWVAKAVDLRYNTVKNKKAEDFWWGIPTLTKAVSKGDLVEAKELLTGFFTDKDAKQLPFLYIVAPWAQMITKPVEQATHDGFSYAVQAFTNHQKHRQAVVKTDNDNNYMEPNDPFATGDYRIMFHQPKPIVTAQGTDLATEIRELIRGQ